MLGLVYRGLKPENVIVRDDGQVILSDFDLSLHYEVSPTLVTTPSLESEPMSKNSTYCIQPACIEPACVQPSCVVLLPPLFSSKTKKNSKPKSEIGNQVTPLPKLIVEPTNAQSMSFVGPREYLAPELSKVKVMEVRWTDGLLGSFYMNLCLAKLHLKDLVIETHDSMLLASLFVFQNL